MKTVRFAIGLVLALALLAATAAPSQATHSWNGYHWARASNPFTLKVGDNVGTTWDAYLDTAVAGWTTSTVLDMTKVTGSAGNKRCSPPTGRVEVCNASYGYNGWLGVAGITVSSGHITSGYVKLNDSYFNTSTYNKPEWRNLVTCQELGHTLGLDHQDTVFDNPNLGSCMDYTNLPKGPPDNEYPNTHDYDQLGIIYGHSDSTTTVGASTPTGPGKPDSTRISTVDEHGNGTVTWIFPSH